MTTAHPAPRTALFLPASNPRAIEKAAGLDVDMVILDLEDAVRPEDKERARRAAQEARYAGKIFAIRVNGEESALHREDLRAVAASSADYVVLPKVEDAAAAKAVAVFAERPLLAMIETPRGVLAAPAIAASEGVVGLIAGTNDLAATLRLPPDAGRGPLWVSLQMIVLAARAAGVWALDGVFNALADPEGLAAECAEGRRLGFDGKTLVHPDQIEPARLAFAPSEREIADAEALVQAATGGAERFGDRMIEAMHVEQARALLERSGLRS